MNNEKRDLDGFYLRVKRGDHYENRCFTDLTEKEQDEWLARLSADGLKSMVNTFCRNIRAMCDLNLTEAELRVITMETAKLLRNIGDRFNIVAGRSDEE